MRIDKTFKAANDAKIASIKEWNKHYAELRQQQEAGNIRPPILKKLGFTRLCPYDNTKLLSCETPRIYGLSGIEKCTKCDYEWAYYDKVPDV
jgi:hypothetical protein